MYIDMSMYMSTFRDLESGLSQNLKDGERGSEKGKRWWKLVAILTVSSFVTPGERGEDESNNLSACGPQDSRRRTASSGEANGKRNRARVVLDQFSNLKVGKIEGFCLVDLWGT